MATSSSSTAISSSSHRYFPNLRLSFSLPPPISYLLAHSFSSLFPSPSSLFAPRPLVSCPYRGILEHSMVHPVLHIMYPTTVFRPLSPSSPFPSIGRTCFISPAHTRSVQH